MHSNGAHQPHERHVVGGGGAERRQGHLQNKDIYEAVTRVACWH